MNRILIIITLLTGFNFNTIAQDPSEKSISLNAGYVNPLQLRESYGFDFNFAFQFDHIGKVHLGLGTNFKHFIENPNSDLEIKSLRAALFVNISQPFKISEKHHITAEVAPFGYYTTFSIEGETNGEASLPDNYSYFDRQGFYAAATLSYLYISKKWGFGPYTSLDTFPTLNYGLKCKLEL